MIRPVMLVVGMALVAAACGSSYEAENRSIVSELPELDAVVLLEEDHHNYCGKDTCVFGDDRSSALLTYSVDTGHYPKRTLVDAYLMGLADWEATVEEGCGNADPSFCDERLSTLFEKGDAQIGVNLDNWPAGQFEIYVNARGGG